jgi:hypothetical protein
MTTAKHLIVLLAAAFAGAACVGEGTIIPSEPNTQPGGASGGVDNTFDHPDTQPDIWELLQRMQEQGPPRFTSRIHSCPKIRYRTLGNLLASRGVNLAAEDALAAGSIYRSSEQALGGPNYGARSRENLDLTTASASKLFDIFVQAAPEIIAAMPGLPRCSIGGQGTRMFNDLDQCTIDGITCLIGVPATASHIEICNQTVARASDPDKGKRMAVALLAAAAHTCE